MKKFTLIVLLTGSIFFLNQAHSQCNFTSAYGSGTASSTTGSTVTLTTCQYAGEYAVINGIVAGGMYHVNVSITSNWVTVRSGSPSGPVVSFALQGTNWTAPVSGTYYAHISNNSSCSTSSACRTTSITTVALPIITSDPCGTSTTILCSTGASFSLSGSGAWSGLGGPYSTPGKEKVLVFAAPSTGTYTLAITNSEYYVDLYYKSTACGSTGWTYVDDIYAGTTSLTLSLTGGQTYYFLIDDENTTNSNVSFSISCPAPAPDPCGPSIVNIASCGMTKAFTITAGDGVWNSYGGPYSVPGRERIFKFTPAVSGSYPILVTHASSGWVDLFYRTNSGGCSSAGWIYIDDIYSSATNSVYLTAGVTYLFMLDDEDILGSGGSITINCPCTGSAVDDSFTYNAPFSIIGNNLGACDNSNLRVGEDLTYAITVNCPATYTFSTCGGATWDTYLYLTAAPGSSVIASNDDACSLQSSISTYLAPGTYYLTLEPYSNGGGGNFTLNVSAASGTPDMGASATDVTCFGATDGTITVSSTGINLLYALNGGTPQSSPVFSGLSAGNYTATVSDCLGNTASMNVVVNEPALLTASSLDGTILCNGETTTVEVSATGGTLPYTGTGTYVVYAGAYAYTVTDANGCTAGVSGSISEPSLLVADAGTDATVYYGYTPMACADLSAAASGGTPMYSFSWSGGSTTVCPSVSGDYVLTVTDANGCVATDAVHICVIDVVCYAGSSGITKVQICHNGNTLCVNESAVPAHLDHGDQLGSCDEVNNCGTTSIAIHSDENRSSAVEEEVVEFTAYPNPSNGLFTLDVHADSEETFVLAIYSADGKLLFTQVVNNGRNEIDLTTYSRGLYLIRIGSQNLQILKN